jgi:hypothetical protein
MPHLSKHPSLSFVRRSLADEWYQPPIRPDPSTEGLLAGVANAFDAVITLTEFN